MADDELNGTAETTEYSPKSTLKAVIVSVIVLAALAAFLLVGPKLIFILSFQLGDTTYHSFGKRRTAEMERIFGISVTEDIKLEEYRHADGWLSDDDDILVISGISDYRAFMDNNIAGEIISETVRDDIIRFVYANSENAEIWADLYPQQDGTYSAELLK